MYKFFILSYLEHFVAIIHKTVTVTLHKANCIKEFGTILCNLISDVGRTSR